MSPNIVMIVKLIIDPNIISDTMTPLYSDVFKMPSEISDHDAAVAFLKCPKIDFMFIYQRHLAV
jgi:hypothetical protein